MDVVVRRARANDGAAEWSLVDLDLVGDRGHGAQFLSYP
jgi:hypothetical protein